MLFSDFAVVWLIFFECSGEHRDLHSFPTRRSSDLCSRSCAWRWADGRLSRRSRAELSNVETIEDRKSTRLNSSHQIISYAVFCLKKKQRCTSRSDFYELSLPYDLP